MLIVHGALDAIVKPAAVDQHKSGLPHAHVEMMSNVGHSPFWEDAATFNEHLRAFCAHLALEPAA